MMEKESIICDSDGMLEAMEDEKIKTLKTMMKDLHVIWNNVGVDEEQKMARSTITWGYLFDLLKDIVEEEKGFYEDIKERIRNYEKKISELSAELTIQKVQVTGTLIVKEEILRKELDKLSKQKHNRCKEFKDLHAVELKYCKLLGMPPLNLSFSTGVPSEANLDELRHHVNMLKNEKEHRLKKFCFLKKELTTILETTELSPETSLEKEILSSKDDYLSLSNETFKLLEQMMTKTKNKKADLEKERGTLIEKLSILWDRLKIDQLYKEAFLSKHNDCRVSNLNAIKGEIARCEEIKRQNIQKYIDGLKEELLELWEKCFIAESDRKFPVYHAAEVTEDALEEYDKEVSKWRQYYKETEHILLKIQKREKLWDLMIVFENKASDPNRFKNRRGNLLQEERERKKLQKDLPKLENEIFLDIEKYEESGIPFLHKGENFREFVTKQWEDRQAQKENEKVMRQKFRTKQIENEITLGVTSSKRQFCNTPKSAPSKLFKSVAGVPIYRTPSILPSKPIPCTIAKMKGVKQPLFQSNSLKKSERNVLKENNQNKPAGSSALDSTTYADFADKLNRSSRYAHRSSVLSSRKVAGTRISINGNKSLRKSLRKKAEVSKMTPARGKLGLPFLI